MEDLEQIFLRSWRESHLTETRQPQQAPPQPCPPAPGAVAQVTSAQLPWLAGLAASSCNDSVHIIECTHSLAEGLSEMFRLLVEGKLAKTNYVVIICACRSSAIDSCIAVTGEAPPHPHPPPRRLAGWGSGTSCVGFPAALLCSSARFASGGRPLPQLLGSNRSECSVALLVPATHALEPLGGRSSRTEGGQSPCRPQRHHGPRKPGSLGTWPCDWPLSDSGPRFLHLSNGDKNSALIVSCEPIN